MPMNRTLLLLAAAALAAGCESAPVRTVQEGIASLFQPYAGEKDLAAGIRSYENARYGESARQLQSALDAGLSRPDRVKAHKYLAFIHCASGREGRCREEFRNALAIEPDFELDPAEAGHPMWGPVFRSVKAGR
jgi:Tfp pilus assembly protein PilF